MREGPDRVLGGAVGQDQSRREDARARIVLGRGQEGVQAPGRAAASALAMSSHGEALRSATRLTAGPNPRFSSEATKLDGGELRPDHRGRSVRGGVVDHPRLHPLVSGERAQGAPEQLARVPRHDRGGDRRHRPSLSSGRACPGGRKPLPAAPPRGLRAGLAGRGGAICGRAATRCGSRPATRASPDRADAGDGRTCTAMLRWYWREDRFPRLGLRARVALERHNHAVLARHLDDFAPDVVAGGRWAACRSPCWRRCAARGLPAVGVRARRLADLRAAASTAGCTPSPAARG